MPAWTTSKATSPTAAASRLGGGATWDVYLDGRWAARCATWLLAIAAAALLWRRLSGALTQPPGPAAAALCAIFGLALTVGVEWIDRRVDAASRRSERIARLAATAVAALALWLPGTSFGAVALLWLPLLGAAAMLTMAAPSLERHGHWKTAIQRRYESLFAATSAATQRPRLHRPVDDLALKRSAGSSTEDDRVVARQSRRVDADGGETIEGRLIARFETGCRTVSLHQAFCPPLVRRPWIETSLEGENEAEVRVVQALPYAARFDLRLPEPAEEPTTVVLRFVAAAGPEATHNLDGKE